MVGIIPLYKPFVTDELPELNEILHSGALAYGKWGRKFENKLAEYIGNSNIAIVNSFNSAMLVTLTTLGIKAGDEVIASPMSCLASNQPFVSIGAKVVWADIDPTTGTLSPESVEKQITAKTKAIFHNHFCGYPGYVDEINAIGKKKGLFVVDDAIEAFASKYKGKIIGNIGSDATVFSFQTIRLPNTIDGGAIVFKDDELFKRAKLIRDFGIDREKFRDDLGEISVESDIISIGYGATLSEVNSYIGYLQMKMLDKLLDLQYKNAQAWEKTICNEKLKCNILKKDLQDPNYWVFGILAKEKIETILYFRKKGFYASGVHVPNNNYSIFGEKRKLPGVDEFYSKFVALPCGWWVNYV